MSESSLFDDDTTGPGYQVLARKYRPQTFDALIGQDAMVRTLGNAFAADRIAHAFMLTGVRGVGKTTTARIIAKALNCIGPDGKRTEPTMTPCGVCDSCVSIAESRHVDIMEMDAASRTGIGDIRELQEGVRYAPVSARTKVYIIDEVHMLSNQAFNGLLKTLEEPPPHVKFIFATTEIRKVPVTVLSRCQRFDLKRIPPEMLAEHLAKICAKENVPVEADGLALIARAAEGSVRDALSLLDQAIVQKPDRKSAVTAGEVRDMLGLADRVRVAELFESITRGDAKASILEIRSQYDSGADPALVLRDLLEIGHEAARVQALGAEARIVGGADWAAKLRGIAAATSPAQLARLWQMLLKALEETIRAPEPIAAAEMALVRLCAAATLPPPEEIARMLRGAGPSGPPASSRQPESRQDAGGPGVTINSFDDVIALIETQRDVDLQIAVERYVRLSSFAPGVIVFAPAPGMPVELPSRLAKKLRDWTGAAWDVRADAQSGVESFAERRAIDRANALEDLKKHPFVADALAAFPGAEIADWRKPADPAAAAEVVPLRPVKKGPRRKEG